MVWVRYFFKSIIPALIMLGLAFFSGTHRIMLIGLVGFLAFFLVAIALVIEGFPRKKKEQEDAAE